jgi:uracil-DNA glycosylase
MLAMTYMAHLPPSWHALLAQEFEQPYFAALQAFLRAEYQARLIYPPAAQMWRAFETCPRAAVKVVILGQDPYHGPAQANGLCFSVNAEVLPPPSLKNIFKELDADLGVDGRGPVSRDRDLSRWAEQGVLLLNATLTVRAGAAGSHQGKGWEQFTDAVIAALAREREGLVFMLWGNYARKKGACVDRAKHLVLESAHPSPLSAHTGFFGCRHFSQANDYLTARGAMPITW